MQTHEFPALRALSLDGAGVRGVASLLILENLMHRLSPEKDTRPCDVFRLICGTGTAGIIAIMLGRLGMRINDCISAYHSLSRDAFDEFSQPNVPQTSENAQSSTGDAEARSRRLEEAICKIVAQYLPAEEKSALFGQREVDPRKVPLLRTSTSQGTPACHVFVAAVQQSSGRRVPLRSYLGPREASPDVTIVEACLATSAVPLLFAPLRAGPERCREVYTDDRLSNSNLVTIVHRECRLLWPKENITSAVSVGAGAPVAVEENMNQASLAETVSGMITEADSKPPDIESYIRSREPNICSEYFRLDVAKSMAPIDLAESRLLGTVAQRTRSWITENDDLLSRCAVSLGATVLDYEATCCETDKKSRQPATAQLPALSVDVTPSDGDFADVIGFTDPEDSSKLNISLWRTVRLPEDGKVYDLPAGLGRFPLIDASPFKEKLAAYGINDADLIIPMYDREAMYLELALNKVDFANPQRPFAIRPYVGGINAITGDSVKTGGGYSTTQTPVGGKVPLGRRTEGQDYIVTAISSHDTEGCPQWLDGIAVAPGRVKQFVCVPFGTGESIEAQKRQEEIFGGIQLEIIPSLPLNHLRQPPTKDIELNIQTLSSTAFTIWIDQHALVWDLFLKVRAECGRPPLDFLRLVFAGKPLELFGTLDYYGIESQSTIYVVYRLRGGGRGPLEAGTTKRMAIGAGGAISQNIKADVQPPGIWDYSRSRLINIQILNAIYFEELTGIAAPTTPINFRQYIELGIPFFHYYLEDAGALRGNFDNVQSVGPSITDQNSGDPSKRYWSHSPGSCSKCNKNAPYRLLRPCQHSVCRVCYESITVEQTMEKEMPAMISCCPVSNCGHSIDRAVAWPHTSEDIDLRQFDTAMPIRTRHADANATKLSMGVGRLW